MEPAMLLSVLAKLVAIIALILLFLVPYGSERRLAPPVLLGVSLCAFVDAYLLSDLFVAACGVFFLVSAVGVRITFRE